MEKLKKFIKVYRVVLKWFSIVTGSYSSILLLIAVWFPEHCSLGTQAKAMWLLVLSFCGIIFDFFCKEHEKRIREYEEHEKRIREYEETLDGLKQLNESYEEFIQTLKETIDIRDRTIDVQKKLIEKLEVQKSIMSEIILKCEEAPKCQKGEGELRESMIAKLLGISEKTLISRMRNGDFRLTEVEEDGMGDRAFIKYIPNQLQKGAPNGKSTGRICRIS